MKKLLIIIIVLISLFSISASAYYWGCLGVGESIPSGTYTCNSDLCILCLTDSGYGAAPYRCYNEPMCEGGTGGGDVPVDSQDPVITIGSPNEQQTYPSTYVYLDINVDEPVRLQYNDNDGYWRDLCSNCVRYSRDKYFREGVHNLKIRATDRSNNIAIEEVNFNIDTRKPRIRSISPRSGEYVGLTGFNVNYDEDNLNKIELHYGVNAENVVELSNCPSGTDQECTIELDLTSFDGNDVKFYFSVYDKASRVDSVINEVKVDITNPVINLNGLNEDFYNSGRINFDIGLSEGVQTLEWSDNGARARRLCSRCSNYNRDVSLRDGNHDILIRAIDNAGNIHEVERSFIIDSRAPRIRRTYPAARSYANGEFSVMYDEEVSLEEVKLYYGANGDYNQVSLDGCVSGRNQQCSIDVDLSEFDGQEIDYYFSVSDHFSSANSRVTENLKVDITFPELNINAPDNQEYSYYDRVPFDIQTSEEVTLSYSLNGGAFRRLCSRCTSYKYERAFSRGSHNLVIQATDAAGNSVGENRVITVV
jgi:hypothetical protein